MNLWNNTQQYSQTVPFVIQKELSKIRGLKHESSFSTSFGLAASSLTDPEVEIWNSKKLFWKLKQKKNYSQEAGPEKTKFNWAVTIMMYTQMLVLVGCNY